MRRRSQRGFTLIELAVAISIFSIAVLAFYGAFSRAAMSRQLATQSVEAFTTARSAIDRIESDLAGVGPTGYTKSELPMLFALDQERADPFAPTLILLDLTTYSSRGVTAPEAAWSLEGGPVDHGDQARVLWALTSEGVLLRTEFRPPRLLEDPLEFLNIHDAPTLADNVEELTFRFYDGKEWSTAWDSSQSTHTSSKLPILVETSFILNSADDQGLPVHLVSSVFLPMADPFQ
jgi:general secretion pathway protein J